MSIKVNSEVVVIWVVYIGKLGYLLQSDFLVGNSRTFFFYISKKEGLSSNLLV